MTSSYNLTTIEDLENLYGDVNETSLAKETSELTPQYRQWIEAAPFFAFASAGEAGLDCSPRGDATGQLFHILDNKTLAIPDRRGNNRLDTLRNIISNPQVAMLFLTPGINEAVRINGLAHISTDPALLDRFTVSSRKPKSVILVSINAVYFQCARALVRSQLWNPSAYVAATNVPTAGQMTKGASPDFNAEEYDNALPERQKTTLY